MEVILRQTIDKLGRVGEIVTVKNGYARNFLIPRGFAYLATEGNKRRIESEKKLRVAMATAEHADAELLAEALKTVELHFTAKAGEGLAALSKRANGALELPALAAMNGISEGAAFRGGEFVKVAVRTPHKPKA